MDRARDTADHLIVENPGKFYLPTNSGIVTIEEYEKILKIENGKKKA